MRIDTWKGFLLGIRPACYENIERIKPEVKEELIKYPHVLDEKFGMFFHNESDRHTWIEQTSGLEPGSVAYVKRLGETLGYPPKAVDFYSKHWLRVTVEGNKDKSYFFSVKVGMVYCGIQCAGHVDDLEENVQWLWNRYEQPYDIVIKIIMDLNFRSPDFIEPVELNIPYRDFTRLSEVHTKALHHLKQVRIPVKN